MITLSFYLIFKEFVIDYVQQALKRALSKSEILRGGTTNFFLSRHYAIYRLTQSADAHDILLFVFFSLQFSQ